MSYRNSLFFVTTLILLISILSCNKESKQVLSLDMQFDTIVQSSGESNTMHVRTFLSGEMGDSVTRHDSFIFDHEGSFCKVNRCDSVFGKDGVLKSVALYECNELKDTTYIFDGTPLRFKIPIDESRWVPDSIDPLPERKITYDSLGRVLKVYDSGKKIEYSYDVLGRCILEKIDNGISIVHREKTYNSFGKLNYCVCRVNDIIEYTFALVYDKKGVLTEAKQYLYNSGVLDKDCYVLNKYEYDCYGRLVTESEYFQYGKKHVVKDCVYCYTYNDESGFITMRTKDLLYLESSMYDTFRYYSFSN